MKDYILDTQISTAMNSFNQNYTSILPVILAFAVILVILLNIYNLISAI